MGLNDQSLVDVRKVLTGKDGQLFVTVKGQQYLLSESNEFSAQLVLTIRIISIWLKSGLCDQYGFYFDIDFNRGGHS